MTAVPPFKESSRELIAEVARALEPYFPDITHRWREQLTRDDGPAHRAVDDHVVRMHLALHARSFGDHEQARLFRVGADVAEHLAVHPQAFGELDVAFDALVAGPDC